MNRPDFRAAVWHRLSPQVGADDDIVAELAAQLEDAYHSALARGAGPAEAFRQVQDDILGQAESWQRLDDYLRTKRRLEYRLGTDGGRLAALLDASRRYARDAARHLRRDLPFTTAVVLALSLCIGVTGSVFTIVNAVLLRPLPFPDPDRVVLMAAQSTASQPTQILSDIPSYFDRRRQLTAFEELAMFRWIDVVIQTRTGGQRVRGDIGTASLLRLIGVPPLHGRLLDDSDSEPGADREIVFSHPLWRDMFASDTAIVGTVVMVNGQPFTVVGVMPPGFEIFRREARFWIPAAYSTAERADDRRGWLDQYQIGRLRVGVTVEDARQQLQAYDAAEVKRFPFLRPVRERTGYHTTVKRLQDVITEEIRPTLTLLLVGAVIVLLLGLLNVTTLTVARSRRYVGELATRQALGASWGALTLHLVSQGVIIAGAAGAAGLLLARGILAVLSSVGLHELPRAEGLGLEAATVTACAVAAALAAGAIGLAPLTRLAGTRLVDALRDSAPDRASVAGRRYLRWGLVTLQVAAALVLTAAAAVTFVSLGKVLAEDPGFAADGLITVSFDLPQPQYPDVADAQGTVRQVLKAALGTSGVRAAGVTQLLPFGGRTASLRVRPQSLPAGEAIGVWNYVVSPGYFAAMQIPLIAGRYLDDQDTADAEPVVVIDRNLARRLWPRGNAIGERLRLPPAAEVRPHTVVGIVADVRQASLPATDADTRGAMYRSFSQTEERSFTLALRAGSSDDDMDVLGRRIAAVDPRLVLYDARPMRARVSATMAPRRLALAAGAMFAGTALLLAAVGLYAVLTYHVAERRREFAVRLALGSPPGSVARLVLVESLAVSGAGLTIGVVALRWLWPVLEPHLYAMGSWPVLITGGAGLVVAGTVALASFSPARDASRVDPLTVIQG